ncbi:MAG TPA: LLM class F420-dependent oxidoreductase [Chloroflexota bacterium]|nr:LLM class F420-dependent oxidoreductase [Chloroflexota bacterium]
MKLKLGVVFPQTEIGTDPMTVRAYATGVEAAGYDHIVAYDHVFGHRPADRVAWAELGPYTDAHQFHEVFVLFSHLAAITTRIGFATEVLVLPQRQTVLVAKQAAELDLLSGGRLRLGVGVGWNPEEFRALGMDFQNRGARIVEQVETLRRLWASDAITVSGTFHNIASGGINPRPGHAIPVWIGGHAPVAIKRAAAIADGLMLGHSVAEAPQVIGYVKEMLTANDRDPAVFGFAARLQLDPDDMVGTLEKARAWVRTGISHLSISTMDRGVREPHEHLQLLREFIEAWSSSNEIGAPN